MRLAPARLLRRILILSMLAFLLIPAGSASAGRLFVTGHDPDWHCAREVKQCHLFTTALDFVRQGARDPSKPILVVDRDDYDVIGAMVNSGYPIGDEDAYTIDGPRNPAFNTIPLDSNRWSAIVIASDQTCGGVPGCDLNEYGSTPDSNALNRRSAELVRFFNGGGGILAFSGAMHGDGNAANGVDNYYGFLPLPIGGAQTAPPYCLTYLGAAIGMEDSGGCPDSFYWYGANNDINCCETHNVFRPVSEDSGLLTAEIDVGPDGFISDDDYPMTLVAEGTIVSGGFDTKFEDLPPPIKDKTVNLGVKKGTIRVKRPTTAKTKGVTFEPLKKPRVFPVGTTIDARKGTVLLATASPGGQRQVAELSSGIFQVIQNRKTRGITETRLKGGNFRKRCRTRKRRKRRARRSDAAPLAESTRRRRRSRRRVRRIRFNGSGRFRTRARGSSGTVRGTIFSATDRCDGTLWKVKRGRVLVRHGRKKVRLRAGKSYLAKRR